MHFYQNERIALFIDGANLYSAAKALLFRKHWMLLPSAIQWALAQKA